MWKLRLVCSFGHFLQSKFWMRGVPLESYDFVIIFQLIIIQLYNSAMNFQYFLWTYHIQMKILTLWMKSWVAWTRTASFDIKVLKMLLLDFTKLGCSFWLNIFLRKKIYKTEKTPLWNQKTQRNIRYTTNHKKITKNKGDLWSI